MLKNVLVSILSVFLLLSTTGCVAILAGGAGGAGTAYWLSNKLVQQVNAPYNRAIQATESALRSLKLDIKKKTVEQNVAQIRSEYSDGKEIWVDIRRISETSSKVEVRVGAVHSDKEAAEKILKAITAYL